MSFVILILSSFFISFPFSPALGERWVVMGIALRKQGFFLCAAASREAQVINAYLSAFACGISRNVSIWLGLLQSGGVFVIISADIKKEGSFMKDVRVRFAPSPTGYLHIGGARTALFNWYFAKSAGGVMVLRIEDTDAGRLLDGSVDQIITSLDWLGIDYDEGPGKGGDYGPYFQSERKAVYERYAQMLIDSGNAYWCFCSSEQLEADRKEQRELKKPFRYSRRCRDIPREEAESRRAAGEKAVLRVKLPIDGDVKVNDLIHGEVVFDLAQLDDFIVMKSSGDVTYNFACVADDHEMKISHVLRAEEHLSNTPKQVLLYEALGLEPPQFGHMPMILAPDRSKLSKRHGATSVEEFRADGYLPEAIVNYLTLLGWGTGSEEEFWSKDAVVKAFDISQMSKKAAVYDVKKLTWMNGQYMSDAPVAAMLDEAISFMVSGGLFDAGYAQKSRSYLEKLVDVLRVRVKTLKELADAATPFFRDVTEYDEKGKAKYLTDVGKTGLKECADRIEKLPVFDTASLEVLYDNMADEKGIKLGELVHPSRLALTGRTVSPGLFDVMELLGKEKTIERMRRAADI